MIRLMVVSTGLGTGGAEMMLWKLAESLPRADFEIQVMSLRDHGTIGPRLEAAGIVVHVLNMQRPGQALLAVPRAHRLVQSFRPEILVGWMYHGNLFASLLWRLARGRAALIWSIRQTLYRLADEPMLTRLVIQAGALVSRRPAAIIYNSELAAHQHGTLGFVSDHNLILPNGFDLDRFRPARERQGDLRRQLGIDPDAFVVGHVARYHPMKDHGTFLRAAAMLADQAVQFVCVGRGVDTGNQELIGLIQRLDLTGRVHLLGEVTDVAGLLPMFDCLCSSSARGEGFPNVLGEAMACAVPCVVTDVGDSASIVGDSGIVVPAGRPDLLAQALAHLLTETPADREGRGERARSRVMREFALPAVAGRYGMLFHDVLVANPEPRQGARA